MKRSTFAFALLAVSLGAVPAAAENCGEPPLTVPSIPGDGGALTTDELRDARDTVIAYSNSVDAYLACMDERMVKLSPYMTKDQYARWTEDSNALHDGRRDLQIKLNEAIRAYRRAQG
ncbi:hypothetical protein [Gimibacter soli]|uniref:UrcA family protein n=1 Tax=Gimibacter soli TaxID=3024400 RepID=A0AAE9XRX5_9PROT|nr:hypothetical protein [Gimibacter soli]WCL54994.1 hypothetical protein PH603_04380 [Gimibacter soli]